MNGFRVLAAATLAVTALAAAAALAQPAPAQKASAPKQTNECFLSSNVNGFNAPDDHTLYIRVGVSEIYRLELMSDCINLTFRQSLGIKSSGASPWICSPLDAEIVYHDTGMRQRCPVTAIHKLTKEEVAALPKKDRP